MINIPNQILSILMVTHGLGLEGAPRSFVMVAKGLASTGQWRIIVFSHTDGPLRAELEASGIAVIIAPKRGNFLFLPDDITELERYCRVNLHFLDLSSLAEYGESLTSLSEYISKKIGFLPDIIISNTVLGFWAIKLAILWNKPSVWCIHESESPFSHLEWLPEELFTLLPDMLVKASMIVFVANTTRDVFLRTGYVFKSMVIPLGLPPDMPVFAAVKLDRNNVRLRLNILDGMVDILALGSVFERKGQIDLCQALGLLPKEILGRIRCHIVGDRPGTSYSNLLHDCIAALQPEAREVICVVPETPEIAQYYRSADIFVLCSRMESYPFVILEALSIGLPIITTPVFGIREQLTEDSALFYEPGDVQSLAKHLTCLVVEEDLRNSFAYKSRNRYTMLPRYDAMIYAYQHLCRYLQ